jgi:hypothetical protein|tara:strand:+ start:147 stop:308 length:162 start_codon:yes stop_codon:yes gene_type:complete
MKRIIYITIFVIGLFSFSSCRSTSTPCGLAENLNKSIEQSPKQAIFAQTLELV